VTGVNSGSHCFFEGMGLYDILAKRRNAGKVRGTCVAAWKQKKQLRLLTLAERAPGMALSSTRAAEAKSWTFMLMLGLSQKQNYEGNTYNYCTRRSMQNKIFGVRTVCQYRARPTKLLLPLAIVCHES
jgi:hypothetical protein